MPPLIKPSTLAAVCMALTCQTASALGSDLRAASGYLGGAYGSIWVHELGHALTLNAMGATDIHVVIPRQDCWLCGETRATPPEGGFRPMQVQAISASGLLAGNLASEWVMHQPSWRREPLGSGFLGGTLYANISHVVRYYTQRVGVDGYRGNDIDAFEAAGGNPHLFSAALLTYTAWTLHRMQKQRTPFFCLGFRF